MRIIATVTNDLNYDQRMIRICSSLVKAGHEVRLVGRTRAFSKPLKKQQFEQHRMSLLFDKGKLFYIEYNLRLFWYLLWHKTDVHYAVDLDSFLPNYFVAKLKGAKILYDAHEYFPEVEEVVARPKVKHFWEWVERKAVPNVPGYTVSYGIQEAFKNKYGRTYELIRNITVLQPIQEPQVCKGYILYQGAVNYGRGLEELILALQYFTERNLVICGLGDIESDLKALVKDLGLQNRVEFKGYVDPLELRAITEQAWLGITFFTKAGQSNYYSLANRFFDYMHAEVPQLVVNYPEYCKVIEEYKVGVLQANLEPKAIANTLNSVLSSETEYVEMKKACKAAKQIYCWQAEEVKLFRFFENL